MKRKLIQIISCLSVMLLLSCSSDDTGGSLMKSYKTDNAPSPGFYDAFFEYSNGNLTKIGGFHNLAGVYQYDKLGKLKTKQVNGEVYSYKYDNQNRLIKQLKNGSDDNITLKYGSDKITITNSYGSYGNKYVEVSEIYLDSKGRISKTKQLTPTSSYTSMVQEYSYDSGGNIVQLRYKENNYNDPDVIVNYTYDRKKNPFYKTFEKLYQSIYYLECRNGIPNYKHMGITPNNMTVYGSSTYDHTYNGQGYPIQWMANENGGSSMTLRTIEYY